MSPVSALVRRLYGERILHLLVTAGALALTGYTVMTLGVGQLVNNTVWWQSIAVWFGLAVIAHDLVLFPLYAVADRLISTRSTSRHRTRTVSVRAVALINYVRMPTLAAGLVFLLFVPGIIEQGAPTYQAATGLTQAPYLARWLLLTATFYLIARHVFSHASRWGGRGSGNPRNSTRAETALTLGSPRSRPPATSISGQKQDFVKVGLADDFIVQES